MKKNHLKKTGTVRSALGGQRVGRGVAMLALLIALILGASFGVMRLMERRAHSAAEKLVSDVVVHIDEKMQAVETVTLNASHSAALLLDDPAALELLVRNFVADNSFVYGSTVAFEPDAFPEYGRCFAPYSWKTESGEVRSRQLGEETDYYQEEWYAATKLTGDTYWCEPYFDIGGAKVMMCTFSVPLKDSNGNLVAVMTADVGLEDLADYISTISPISGSGIALRTANGTMLASAGADSSVGGDSIFIKGVAKIGWTVELSIPFNYLMHGDSGVLFFIIVIFLITVILVYVINRLLHRQQQRSSEEYNSVIDAISSGFSSIYLLDLQTGETVVFRDPEGYGELLGTLESDGDNGFTARLKKLIEYDAFAPDRERMLMEITPEVIRARLTSQERYDVRFRKEKNGMLKWFEMQGFVMERSRSGAPLRAVLAFSDVNESVRKEKETQETLEQALEMAESANRAKSTFLFNMSHDIRTPMNAITGFTNMAIKHIDDRPKVLDALSKVQQSGSMLLSLINSVLEVSHIESGKAVLEEQPGDVFYSFVNIEATMRELAEAKDIDLTFEVTNIRDKYVYCDFSRCMRVFVNVISNAIKYTKEGGFVRVRCEQLGKAKGGYGSYLYTVTDNGIGMSEEFQKHVFEQFSRETTATVSGIQGTGLGMAVVKSFVELMKGTVEVRSRQGEGTEIRIVLPFRLQDGASFTDPLTGEVVSPGKQYAVPESADFNGKNVLLVEDNELNREIAVEILEESGLVVEEAEDGTIAVEMLREKGPDYYDFILMDIQMPKMNGYEATGAIREMYPDVHIPIIALSANAFAEDKAASVAAGMDDHVAKPINLPELFAALKKHL